ncbi:MAG: HEAT repeat domain-containing protein [Deltaproteobacteria bacterium]|nr:HEAT repeat domain-containing protein [Deltaproteobacteria bacterium]
MASAVRLVPRVDDAEQAFMAAMDELDWLLIEVKPRDEESGQSFEMIYGDESSGDVATFTQHMTLGLRIIAVTGPRSDEVADLLRERLDAWPRQAMLELWARGVAEDDVDDRVDAVLLLGVCAPATEDPELASPIQDALEDANEDVRNAAIVAVTFPGWERFRPMLEHIAANDPDEVARQRAQLVLKNWAALDALG